MGEHYQPEAVNQSIPKMETIACNLLSSLQKAVSERDWPGDIYRNQEIHSEQICRLSYTFGLAHSVNMTLGNRHPQLVILQL